MKLTSSSTSLLERRMASLEISSFDFDSLSKIGEICQDHETVTEQVVVDRNFPFGLFGCTDVKQGDAVSHLRLRASRNAARYRVLIDLRVLPRVILRLCAQYLVGE